MSRKRILSILLILILITSLAVSVFAEGGNGDGSGGGKNVPLGLAESSVPDGSTNSFYPADGSERTAISAVPIITAGDVSGAVAFMTNEKYREVTDLQKSLINASAQFLARQIEG